VTTKRRRRLRPFTVAHFREYCRRLTLDSGAPWELEDFQLEIVRPILAGVREVWVLLPEGNAKTTLISGICLYHADYTSSPWVPIGAASRDQAEIMFGQAAGFIERSPGLQKRFVVHEGLRRIKSRRNGGRGIKVYAAAVNTGDGVIPTLCAIDEGHRQKDLGLYNLWTGKLWKRGAQILMSSTAGEPGSSFEETRDRIRERATRRRRRAGCLIATGPHTAMLEWKVPSLEKVEDLRAVKAANPLSTITKKSLREKRASPSLDYNEDWLRRTCNIPARSTQAAITDQEFDSAETRKRIPEGEVIDVGLDIAWKWDTTAIVPLWMPRRTLRLFGKPVILVPPRDGTMLSAHKIEDAFTELHARNPIRFVVMDREKGESVAQWLEEELGVEVVERGRTNEPASMDYERFMEGLREGWIKHTGDAGFRRHAMNAVVRHLPGDKKRFDRPSSSRRNVLKQDQRVIDALDAGSMVHSVAEAAFGNDPPPLNLDDYRIETL
jgi:phage terminase large subunit-like protein